MPETTTNNDENVSTPQTKTVDILKTLVGRRGRLKGTITKFGSWLAKLESGTADLTVAQVNQLKLRMETVHQTFHEFNTVQDEIEFIDNSADQKNYASEVENAYYDLAADGQTILDKYTKSFNETNRSELNSSHHGQASPSHVKLPTMQLPTFDGSFDQWIKFRDIFESVINSNETLSDVQRFQYLRSSLKDAALETIKSLPLSASNYPVAWDRLCKRSSGEVLLSTAVIEIVNKTGRPENCRVLLDSAAQSNFITESLARKLQLKLEDVKVPIVGIGGKCAAQVKKQVTGTIKSRTTAFTATLEFLVMPVIIERLPSACLPTDLIAEPPNITLADPRFNEAAPIDALLGARLFWKLICVGQINIHPHKDLLLQKTQLGWVISGILETCPEATKKTTNAYHTNVDFNAFMAKFWELEELPSKPTLMTPEEMYCEEHFTRHVTRNQQGRFVVSLPFLETRQSLGDSAQIAKRRFFSIERKLIQNPELRAQYRQFMQEYKDLNHMSELADDQDEDGYFLPHHCVTRQASTTTKLRVVFDGSAKTSNGVALNETLAVGPTIQSELFSIILRFRTYSVVLTADIEKMYRQILVAEADRKFQKIYWRDDHNAPIKAFKLNTVTYGTSSAPYLATKCLTELGKQAREQYPREAATICEDFYVDDLITGANSTEEANQLHVNIAHILQQGGFQLRKWRTNNEVLRQLIKTNEEEPTHVIANDDAQKTLGLLWNSQDDHLQYAIDINPKCKATKRSILSTTSQLFDPLALLGPVIVSAKVMMQKLWQLKLDWDESIPMDLYTQLLR
ncbi:uncharacterized protein LOC116181921 [Photinus pyralis]|uniref:uncharacterized protein LOC116181921 n=1 Tax=Photinus pyralis TaxID=7054 RepID=UPI001266ED31|nr:uncharacterized protein LOC116181921 [Photinus pyralis]